MVSPVRRNLFVDLAAGACALVATATGFLIWFVVPPGTNRSLSLWGLTRHQWGSIHAFASAALVGLVAVHVVAHWRWIVSSLKGRAGLAELDAASRRAAVLGVIGLVAGSAALGAAAVAGTRPIADPHELPTCASPGASAASAPDGRAILARACTGCHGARRQAGGVRLDRREDVLGAVSGRTLVAPGRPDESELLRVVRGERAISPAEPHRLGAADVEALRAWIEAGAPWAP